jgi:hypothetical protein
MVISRHVINPNLVIHHHTGTVEYAEFSTMVDRWKTLLVKEYGAKVGQRIVLEFLDPDPVYYAAVFAAWELGLILIAEWPPAFNDEDVNSHRMTMHGRIDFAIVEYSQTKPTSSTYNYWNHRRNTANVDYVITDAEFKKYTAIDASIANTIYAQPNDDAIWGASGGTTGQAKHTKTTHSRTLLYAQRLIKPLGYKETDHCLHITNLLYGAGMAYYFLPTWMTAREHSLVAITDTKQLVQVIEDKKINKVKLHTLALVLDYLEQTHRLDHDLDILSIFNINDRAIEQIKEKNIQSVKMVFGDTTIGLAFFYKVMDQTTTPTTYKRGCVGQPVDDLYTFEIRDGILYIAIPSLGQEWRTSQDRFTTDGQYYYFFGRGNTYNIGREKVVLGDLDLEVERLFGVGATIVVDDQYDKIYLAIWKDNPRAEAELTKYFENQFEQVRINQIARNLDVNRFIVSRKIDREKVRDYFRYYHLKPVSAN